MVAPRNRDQTLSTPANPQSSQIDGDGGIQSKGTEKVSGYEHFREERIKANLERMQKLGIFDLSLKLKSVKAHRRTNTSNRKSPNCSSPLLPSGPRRRSSRLQNVTPVSYCEKPHGKKDVSLEHKHDLLREEGSKPEIYTDEHEKLLGKTEMAWTLFVDGYGKDGRRIYDQIKGKTCHQCRQKTLGHRTHCSQCGMVQGQFCGDCLYMRYGEHVLEANRNPNWICPVCRGICNCSLCRQAKGWAPTGPLYKKIAQMGYKSVAHYLIQTRQSQNDLEKIPVCEPSEVPVSAKRSLGFSETEAKSEGKGSPILQNDCPGLMKCEGAENDCEEEQKETNLSEKGSPIIKDDSHEPRKCEDKAENDFEAEKQKETNISESKHGSGNIAFENSQEVNEKYLLNSESSECPKTLSQCESVENKTDDKPEIKEATENAVAAGNTPKSKRMLRCTSEPNTDSIGGRLRQRRRMGKQGRIC